MSKHKYLYKILLESVWCLFFLLTHCLSKAHSACPCRDSWLSPPGKEMYNWWSVSPVRVPERVVCVQIDGQTEIPRVTVQASQSNKCCSLNNSGLDLRCGLATNTTHGYGFRAGGRDPDGGTIKKWKGLPITRKNLFSSSSVEADLPPPRGSLFPGRMTHFYFCNCALSSQNRTVDSKKSNIFRLLLF